MAPGAPAPAATPGTPPPVAVPAAVQPPAAGVIRIPVASGVGADTPELLQAFLRAMGQEVPTDEADLRETAKRFSEDLESLAKRQRLQGPAAEASA
eukprot:5448923-Pyramimonas_sp.AAC.1